MFNSEYLRELRYKKNITMRQVADSVGVAESTICCYETGKRQPSLITVKRLADFYKINWTKFFRDLKNK